MKANYMDTFSLIEKINSTIVKTKNKNANHCFQYVL